MAALRNRNGKWQAQVRIKGHAPRTKSFISKRDAERWARQTETELEATVLRVDHRVLDRTSVRDLLDRYRKEVTVRKRGIASEEKRLDAFLRQAWAGKPLSKITPQDFSRYRDERLQSVSLGTVIRDLGLLRSVFEVARLEWDIPLPENPVAKVRKPKAPDARERRLEPGELDLLLDACGKTKNTWLRSGILLAVETGMRRGELLSLQSVSVGSPSKAYGPARPTFRQREDLLIVVDDFAAADGLHHFFRRASCSIVLSKVRSATSRFNLEFSSSSCSNRRILDTPIPA